MERKARVRELQVFCNLSLVKALETIDLGTLLTRHLSLCDGNAGEVAVNKKAYG